MKNHPDAFPDSYRNTFCAGRLNAALGMPKSVSKFEYYDIALSRNTILRRHIDQKIDHRRGYNYCVVYSFYHNVNLT